MQGILRLLDTNTTGSSCLYESAVARRWDIAELLLDAGGEELAWLEVSEGDSLMLHAEEEGELAIVQRMLLLCGPQVALIPGQSWGLSRSSTHLAASGGHPEVLQVLLTAAQELLREVDNNCWTCLHVAASAGNLAVLEVLLSAAPELLREVDKNGRSCLHVTVNARRVQVVELARARGLVPASDSMPERADTSGHERGDG